MGEVNSAKFALYNAQMSHEAAAWRADKEKQKAEMKKRAERSKIVTRERARGMRKKTYDRIKAEMQGY